MKYKFILFSPWLLKSPVDVTATMLQRSLRLGTLELGRLVRVSGRVKARARV